MPNSKHKQISILAVDDNPLDILILQTLLQHHFKLKTVSSGKAALKIIEEIDFDMILMDINLGDETLNGTDTMKLIRKNSKYQHIKIFAVTAYAEDESFYINEGFDELYIKPVIKEDIFEFINKNLLDNDIAS